MKNIILLILVGVLTPSGLTAQSEVESATEAKKDADMDLIHREAEIDSAAGFEAFRKNAESQISANDKKLTLLKEKKYSRSKSANELMAKKIVELGWRNRELSVRLSDYRTRISWASFKRKFLLDMNQLIDEIRVLS